MNVVTNDNEVYRVYGDGMQTMEKFPPKVYTIEFDPNSGPYCRIHNDIEIKEDKIYGAQPEKVEKVLNSFGSFQRNLGVILSGDKGIGKSLFAKMLSIGANAKGYPVFIIESPFPGLTSYVESIEQECVIILDEFDKMFRDNEGKGVQAGMLSMFDGFSTGKKLFVVTCNDIVKLNEFIVNRPGRFHYHLRFAYPNGAEIAQYLEDKLRKEMYGEIPEVVAFSRRIELNYDCLRAIAFEINLGIPFREAISDLNILNTTANYYTIRVSFRNGVVGESRARLNFYGKNTLVKTSVIAKGKKRFCIGEMEFDLSDSIYDVEHDKDIVDAEKVSIEYNVEEYDDDDNEIYDKEIKELMNCGIEKVEIVKPNDDGIRFIF